MKVAREVLFKVFFGIVSICLLATTLAAGPAFAAGEVGKGGASCSYDLCMSRCLKAGGRICTDYCEKTLKDRKLTGVCK